MYKMIFLLPIVTACTAPDYVDLKAGFNQYKEESPICLGNGVSDHLTSEVGFNVVWLAGSDLSAYAGYSKEYCMLNDESAVSTKVTGGVGYRFDL